MLCAGDWAQGNMWSCSEFAQHLNASCAQKGLWQNHIQPQMQRIVQYSLACATVSQAHHADSACAILSLCQYTKYLQLAVFPSLILCRYNKYLHPAFSFQSLLAKTSLVHLSVPFLPSVRRLQEMYDCTHS